NATLCVMVCAQESTLFDEMQKEIRKLDFKEQELGICCFADDGLYYFGYIVLSTDADTLISFQEVLQRVLTQFAKTKKNVPTLNISLPRPTSLLDPRIGTDRTSGIVIKMLYEGLLRVDPSGRPTPAVAAAVKVSADKKQYIFQLRQTKWTNGRPVTAHDFAYAWKKVLDPHFKTPYSYLFYPIRNAKRIKLGQLPIEQVGIIVRDDHTLEVLMEHPAPYFLELTAHWIYSPLCKEVDELNPGWAYYGDDTYVCNGPFRLAKWNRNSEIQVLKNDLYWEAEAVRTSQINISIIEDPHRALSLYERGDLDFIGEPLSEIPHEAFKIRNFENKIITHPITAVHWYECNLQMAPFSSKKCRQALAIALSRKDLIEKIFSGIEKPAFSILPPGLSQHKEPYFRDSNPLLAKQLFHEGLQELGVTFKELGPFSICCSDQPTHHLIAHAASKQWKEILGLDCKIEICKWDRFMEKRLERAFHIMATTWYSWVYDPSYNLEHLSYPSNEMNVSGWHNASYTEYFEKAQHCLDKKERLSLLHEAENIVMEEIPVIPVFYYTFKYMKKEHLNNIYLSRLGQIDFKWASVN
ncbi:MAG: peptide ABC transporter substrate-binding protein, partial [Verrucomicrobia bacterium]|nr:peptide ABC transporter substrate-binding protein [Verrucomicrobiota bacterium]